MLPFPYPFDFDVQPFVIVGAFLIECHYAAFHKNNYFLNIRKQSAILFLKFRKRSTAHVFCKIHKRSRNVFHKIQGTPLSQARNNSCCGHLRHSFSGHLYSLDHGCH